MKWKQLFVRYPQIQQCIWGCSSVLNQRCDILSNLSALSAAHVPYQNPFPSHMSPRADNLARIEPMIAKVITYIRNLGDTYEDATRRSFRQCLD